jgi:ABC-2 type transport system permease protein
MEKPVMSQKYATSIGSSLNIIWTIAAKDALDALKNRVVLSMILMLSLVLLLPKLLPLIFEVPQAQLPVYESGASAALAKLKDAPSLSLLLLPSEQELDSVLCGAIYPLIGLHIPANFDEVLPSGAPLVLQGSVCWGKRFQVSDLQPGLEASLSQALGKPVTIQLAGNTVTPPAQGVLSLSLAMVNSVLMILMMGIFLVPSLLFEEKETKTIQALLVSPASISQVVIGKALVGLFYILVTAVIIFAISWAEVVHWEAVILFVAGSGIFSVAVGLVLGSFFEKQQDIVGWMTVLLLLLVGVVLAVMLKIEVPALVQDILPWVPSVALAEICRAAFTDPISMPQVLTNLWMIFTVSLPLYALVVWKIRRSDR